jgi:methylglyoxal synthase
MHPIKNIAVVAHDNCKKELLEWIDWNHKVLLRHNLIATGTTGGLVEKTLQTKKKHMAEALEMLPIYKLKSGPLGGDQQLGALIAEGKVDILIFFWDPMQPQPHDVDVKALLRLAVLYNVPTACNRSSADFMISSPLIESEYKVKQNDFAEYVTREIK